MKTIRRQLKNGNFYLAIAFLMMVVLFISSSQTYQQQSQVGLLQRLLADEPLKDRLSNIAFSYAGSEVSIAHQGYFKFVEFFIRKGAHFICYFIVGWGLFNGSKRKMNGALLLSMVLSWLAATGYAALDEFHQMLTGGRTPLFQDVMLDSIGAATAILLSILLQRLFGRKRR